MRRTKRTKTRTATGVSLAAALLLCLPLSLPAADKKPKLQPEALVAGTVFRTPGFALPGAEVTLVTRAAPGGKKPGKPQKLVSDGRGEFVFRVKSGQAQYLVQVRADGFQPQEKSVDIAADERIDVYFELKPVGR